MPGGYVTYTVPLAGWPYQDLIELELLAAGLLEHVVGPSGHAIVQLTPAGVRHVAQTAGQNRQARSAHDELVKQIARHMQREGRIVWTGLNLRARVTSPEGEGSWRWCMPDVFSTRNSSVESYLEPVVHEIKVSRADLLGDLKRPEKRQAYLDVGGQCWYVLGPDARGRAIGSADEIPVECGVMVAGLAGIEVLRAAPKRPSPKLPFAVWMALAKDALMERGETGGESL
jgi:hypothetical protein